MHATHAEIPGRTRSEAPAAVRLRGRRIVFLIAAIALMIPAPVARAGAAKEYQVKASIVLKIAQNMKWPPGTFPNQAVPFNIGVLGDDPFGEVLDQTMADDNIQGHKIVIKRANQLAQLNDCHLIFICRSEKAKTAAILAAIGKGVLTIGETEAFAEKGGMFNFYIEANRVRLEINPSAAARGGLNVSLELRELGKVVGG